MVDPVFFLHNITEKTHPGTRPQVQCPATTPCVTWVYPPWWLGLPVRERFCVWDLGIMLGVVELTGNDFKDSTWIQMVLLRTKPHSCFAAGKILFNSIQLCKKPRADETIDCAAAKRGCGLRAFGCNTKIGWNIYPYLPSWELTLSLTKAFFEDDFPFLKVGYDINPQRVITPRSRWLSYVYAFTSWLTTGMKLQ